MAGIGRRDAHTPGMRPSTAATALALLCTLPLGGCCSLARLFCGPDRSPWVQIDHSTPQATVQTLVEAIRRDAPDVVYDCLAATYRERLRLDSSAMAVAWQQLKAAVPGLHLAGYAEVQAPVRADTDTAEFVLKVEGRPLRVRLAREAQWELHYRRPDGSAGRAARALQSLGAVARLEPVDDPDRDLSRLSVQPMVFEHEGTTLDTVAAIDAAGLVRRWKITDLEVPR